MSELQSALAAKDTDFDKTSARRVSRGYHGSPHDVWRDSTGRKMLACHSRRGPGVAINLAAIEQFRSENGDFVGLQNPDFKVVVPLSQLDGIEPYSGCDYIVVRGSDVGVIVTDNAPCPF